jgi:hypothetical protein
LARKDKYLASADRRPTAPSLIPVPRRLGTSAVHGFPRAMTRRTTVANIDAWIGAFIGEMLIVQLVAWLLRKTVA